MAWPSSRPSSAPSRRPTRRAASWTRWVGAREGPRRRRRHHRLRHRLRARQGRVPGHGVRAGDTGRRSLERRRRPPGAARRFDRHELRPARPGELAALSGRGRRAPEPDRDRRRVRHPRDDLPDVRDPDSRATRSRGPSTRSSASRCWRAPTCRRSSRPSRRRSATRSSSRAITGSTTSGWSSRTRRRRPRPGVELNLGRNVSRARGRGRAGARPGDRGRAGRGRRGAPGGGRLELGADAPLGSTHAHRAAPRPDDRPHPRPADSHVLRHTARPTWPRARQGSSLVGATVERAGLSAGRHRRGHRGAPARGDRARAVVARAADRPDVVRLQAVGAGQPAGARSVARRRGPVRRHRALPKRHLCWRPSPPGS